MVERSVVPNLSAPPGGQSVLRRKLWRDMRRSAMQFIAIVLLCALGTWVYSGLDGSWRMIQNSTETYYANNNLADFWVNASSFSRQDLAELRHLTGVGALQARTTVEMDTPDLGDGKSLQVHAYDGDIAINLPLVRQGALMKSSDLRGCMVEEQFAKANGLAVGDSLTLRLQGEDHDFVIRALILSPEHVITVKDVSPDPEHYGFAIISSRAVPLLPFNEVVIDLAQGADRDETESAIQALLPDALVVNQDTHSSTQRTRNDVTMFRNLSYVFPLLAFAVAAMIVLTTLDRMIENQRVQMGTLKALGYSDRKIRGHYLSYALYPSLFGGVMGVLVGQYTLPDVLWRMEADHYIFPYKLRAPISLEAWLMAAVAVGLSLFICLHAYNKAARENTASLLRPKPPRAGSRILLERIPRLWRRFSFNAKMIVRNLMRNKSRTAMSLLGVLCCNMLIICTLGLQDSIAHVVGEHYTQTLRYDLRADLDSSADRLDSYKSRLDAARVEGVMEKSVSLRSAETSRTALLTVLEDDQTMVCLGKDRTLITLPDTGLVISRKLAENLKVRVGDTLEVWLPGDDEPLTLPVALETETSIGQGVYMAASQWNSFHKGEFTATALFLQKPSALCRHQLEEMDEVSAIKDPDIQYHQSMSILDSTTLIFTIMSGAALGLAFVICYNMGLMNFTERTRDYATLKVLGYHQKEIRRLMLYENDLTSLLGVGLGIWPGVALTQVVLKSCESDSLVFTAFVAPQSILIASVITFVFTWLIEWLLTRKVRSINMVEALKSVE